MTKNQIGFGAIGVIGVIVIVSLMAFSGWTFINRSKNKPTSTAKTSAKQVQAEVGESTNIDQPKEITKYLVIEEWGVKYTLGQSISDATYKFTQTNNQYVLVQTPRLAELANQSKFCTGADESISLNRAKVGDDRFGSSWTEEELQAIGTKIGEYYYFSEGGQPCFGSEKELKQESELITEVSSIRSMLGQLSKTVQLK